MDPGAQRLEAILVSCWALSIFSVFHLVDGLDAASDSSRFCERLFLFGLAPLFVIKRIGCYFYLYRRYIVMKDATH